MAKRFLFIATALVLSACGGSNPLVSETKKSGSFCDQLRYLIITGTEGFRVEGLTGAKLHTAKGEFFTATYLIRGANTCYIYNDAGVNEDRHYVCTFGDETTLSEAELRQRFASLDSDVDKCLEQSNWPGFTDSRDGSHHRYSRGDASNNEYGEYLDAGFRGPSGTQIIQSVDVLIARAGGRKSGNFDQDTAQQYLPNLQAKTVVLIIDGGE